MTTIHRKHTGSSRIYAVIGLMLLLVLSAAGLVSCRVSRPPDTVTDVEDETAFDPIDEGSETGQTHVHKFGNWITVNDPSCTGDGTETRICSCGATDTRPIPAFGHTETADAAVPATCTTDGLTAGSHCTLCGEVLTAQEVIRAAGHTEITDAAVPATCTTDGLTAGSHCDVCGEVLTAQTVIRAAGHTEVTDAAVPATCTTDGLTAGSHCSVCDAVLTAQTVVRAAGHTEAADAAVPAACTTDGLTAGSHCSVCGTVLTAQETIPAPGHTVEIEEEIPATCTSIGMTEGQYCTVCHIQLKRREPIAALGHDRVTDEAVAPTCTADGLTAGARCARCDEVFVMQMPVPALGHAFVTVPAAAPTCTEDGLTEYTACSRCGERQTEPEVIPATGHTPKVVPGRTTGCTQDGLTDGTICAVCGEVLSGQQVIPAVGHTPGSIPARPATCTEDGLSEGSVCTVCGELLTAQEIIPAFGHTPEPLPDRAATCTKTGLAGGEQCAVCGEVLTAPVIVPALGHVPEPVPARPATCTEAGLAEGSRCAVCGVTLSGRSLIMPLGHTYVNHTCIRCGASDGIPPVPDIGLVFTPHGDGTCSVTGIGTCTDAVITITGESPAGDRVTSIDPGAFSGCTALTGVTLPDSLTAIGEGAFSGCTSLKGLTIPASVTDVGKDAFAGCKSLILHAGADARPAGWSLAYNPDRRPVVWARAYSSGLSFASNGGGTCTLTDLGSCTDTVIDVPPVSPDGKIVTGIGSLTPLDGRKITEVRVPASVRVIDDYAFDNGMQNDILPVVFEGTVAQFSEFRFNTYYLYTTSTEHKCFVTCADGKALVIPSALALALNEDATGYELVGYTHPNPDTSKTYCIFVPPVFCGLPVTGVSGEVLSFVNVNVYVPADVTAFGTLTVVGDYNPDHPGTYAAGSQFIYFEGTRAEWEAMPLSVSYDAACPHMGAAVAECADGRIVYAQPDHEFELIYEQDASCTETGLRIFRCTICGAEEQQTTDPLGHDYVGGVCTRCGDSLTESTPLIFESNGDGTCRVIGIGPDAGEDIVIPAVSPDGESVTGIANSAFYGCSAIRSITIPDSVTYIGGAAFEYCTSLSDITLPQGLDSIETETFWGCESLTDITIPDSVTFIGDGAFGECCGLTSIRIPAGVRYMGESVFAFCAGLTVYCEAASKPSGWRFSWSETCCEDGSTLHVVWNSVG